MGDGGPLLIRRGAGQPFDQLVHLGDVAGLGRLVLLGPAADLALEVIARLAVIAKADRLVIHAMQRGQRHVHGIIDRAALLRGEIGQVRVPEDPPLDKIHDVEPAADDLVIGAQRPHHRHRNVGIGQRRHDAEFPVHRMGRFQQLARRLSPQHIGLIRGVQPVGRIGLAALELADGQGAGIAPHIVLHPLGQPVLVEAVRFGDVLDPGKVLLCVRHAYSLL